MLTIICKFNSKISLIKKVIIVNTLLLFLQLKRVFLIKLKVLRRVKMKVKIMTLMKILSHMKQVMRKKKRKLKRIVAKRLVLLLFHSRLIFNWVINCSLRQSLHQYLIRIYKLQQLSLQLVWGKLKKKKKMWSKI